VIVHVLEHHLGVRELQFSLVTSLAPQVDVAQEYQQR
jgi:hypothetical protein